MRKFIASQSKKISRKNIFNFLDQELSDVKKGTWYYLLAVMEKFLELLEKKQRPICFPLWN